MAELIVIDPELLLGKKPKLQPTQGTFIAGGAIRQWFVGNEPSSDIDVFGTNEMLMDGFYKKHLTEAKVVNKNTANTVSYLLGDQLVQVMWGRPFASISDAFDSFDFTVCQFAWDGTMVYATPKAIISVLRNHLGVNKINPNTAADSLRRAFKYQRKGYTPCAGTLRDLGLSFVGLTPPQIQEQVEISPNGGRRFVGID